MSRVLYRVESLTVSLPTSKGQRPILRDIAFDVRAGEVVAVVGRSGVGKTTLMRVLGGLLPGYRGTVTFDGAAVRSPPPGVVMVFQDYGNALLPWRTVRRNAELGLEGRLNRHERGGRVADALRMVGLENSGEEYPSRLSGGMAQRAQLARALALNPAVLLMDEPFGALDAFTRAALQDVLLEVKRRTAATIVFVTHDLDEAIYVSDRVIVLAGSPGEIALTMDSQISGAREQLSTRESPGYMQMRHRLGETLRVEDV